MTLLPCSRSAAAGLVLLLSTAAHAGTITGGSLLASPDADQFETWLGLAVQHFTLAWSGSVGASANDFHTAVNGIGPTISIYSVTRHDGVVVRVGGYTAEDWGANAASGAPSDPVDGSLFVRDTTAFLFNLDGYEVQHLANTAAANVAIYAHPNYFPTFGTGFDLFAGYGSLGTCDGVTNAVCDGYGRAGFVYGNDQGQIVFIGDTGGNAGSTAIPFTAWSVNSLEVYTFADAAAVPEPRAAALFAIGLPLLFSGLRRRHGRPIRSGSATIKS